jgi:hypothetical protein
LKPGSNLRLFQASEGGKGLWGHFPDLSLDLDVAEGLPDADGAFQLTQLEVRAFQAIQNVLGCGDWDHGLTFHAVRVLGTVPFRVKVRALGWAGRASLIRYYRALTSMDVKFRPGVIHLN